MAWAPLLVSSLSWEVWKEQSVGKVTKEVYSTRRAGLGDF